MSPLFTLLGFVDLIAAAMIFYPFSEALILYIMIYMIGKGAFFLLTSLTSGSMSPLFIGFSTIDIITGIVLGAMSLGIVSPVFKTIGMVSVAKGLYSFISPIFS
jgi:hypothetical protein